MKQPDFVEFQTNQNDLSTIETESPLRFSHVKEVMDNDQTHRRKSLGLKKIRTVHTAAELDELKKSKSVTEFPISVSLLNLLRNPKIENHEYDESFLCEVEANLRAIIEKSSERTNRHHVLYIHLILCQIDNLQDL